jgi:hypothetical protein
LDRCDGDRVSPFNRPREWVFEDCAVFQDLMNSAISSRAPSCLTGPSMAHTNYASWVLRSGTANVPVGVIFRLRWTQPRGLLCPRQRTWGDRIGESGPARLRHRISPGWTASSSFGHRKASSAHLLSDRGEADIRWAAIGPLLEQNRLRLRGATDANFSVRICRISHLKLENNFGLLIVVLSATGSITVAATTEDFR